MNAHEIVSRFARRIPNPRKGGAVEWRGARSYDSSSSGFGGDGFVGARIYCESNTLYSYGPHFALAHYLGERDSKSFFLKNGDQGQL